jgi:hypothetical protein
MTESARDILMSLMKVVRDFQDADLTYATRETDLTKKQTEIWHAMNDALITVMPIIAAVNPETTEQMGKCAQSLAAVSEEIYEVMVFRQQNLLRFVNALPELRERIASNREITDGGD